MIDVDERPPRSFGYGRATTQTWGESPAIQRAKVEEFIRYRKLPQMAGWFLDPATEAGIWFRQRLAGGELIRHARRGDHIVMARIQTGFKKQRDFSTQIHYFNQRGLHLHIVDLPNTDFFSQAELFKWMARHWKNMATAPRHAYSSAFLDPTKVKI